MFQLIPIYFNILTYFTRVRIKMALQTFNTIRFFKDNPARLIMIILMLAAGTTWLGYEFWRLLFDSSLTGSIDLKQRYEEAFFWFRGFPIYGVIKTSSYPPASYALLWPFVGWMSPAAARWLWGGTSILCLCWLGFLLVKGSLASDSAEKVLVFLLPFSSYAAGAAIGNGQLPVHILPVLLAALLLLKENGGNWRYDLVIACLFTFALVKPSITAPFFWIVLFVPGSIRIALLVIAGYGVMTALAGLSQDQPLVSLVMAWLESSNAVMDRMAHHYSFSNLHTWLHFLGYEHLTQLTSLVMLLMLGFWTWLNRKTDIWILISVAAINSRLWTYHAWYDDLLIIPGIITLVRFNRQLQPGGLLHRGTNILIYASILLLLAPGGHYLLSSPLQEIYLAAQVINWLVILLLLLWFVRLRIMLQNGTDQWKTAR